ncbi:hypothetical protein [Gymnodinialimonas sp.]
MTQNGFANSLIQDDLNFVAKHAEVTLPDIPVRATRPARAAAQVPEALRKAAAQALEAFRATPDYRDLMDQQATLTLRQFHARLAKALHGPVFAPVFATANTLQLDVSLEGLIPKAISLGVSGQVVLGVGISGSLGYVVDLNLSDFTSALYLGGAVDIGADAGIEGDVCLGFWTNTIDDLSGWYVGEEIDIDDAAGVMEATYLKDEELALAFIGVTLGFDDGFENSDYYFFKMDIGHAPIYQPGDYDYMVQLDSLVCTNSKDDYDTVYYEFLADDDDTVYRYPAWDGFQMAESQRDNGNFTKWGVGVVIKFNEKVTLRLHVGDYTMDDKTITPSDYSGELSEHNVPFSGKDYGIDDIEYNQDTTLLKAP